MGNITNVPSPFNTQYKTDNINKYSNINKKANNNKNKNNN